MNTTSTPVRPVRGSMSTGTPRPLSTTSTLPSEWSVTPIDVPCPANASSTELSMISHKQCMRPRSSVEPMYIPGRLRTASSPSRTLRWRAEYSFDTDEGLWLTNRLHTKPLRSAHRLGTPTCEQCFTPRAKTPTDEQPMSMARDGIEKSEGQT